MSRRKLGGAFIFLVLVVLTVRAGWYVTRSEVGADILIDQWVKWPVRLVCSPWRGTPADEAMERARSLISEVRRVPEVRMRADVALGASWVLDRPSRAFRSRLSFASGNIVVDQNEANRARMAFEELCGPECVAQAASVAELVPDNLDVWRTRALLAFHVVRQKDGSGELRPRTADCLAILDECARHDPENALYDYLAALAEWSESASCRRAGSRPGWEITIRDASTFARGEERLAAGLKKPRLVYGSNPTAAVLAFLEKTSLSAMERVDAAETFLAPYQIYAFNDNLRPWQYGRQAAHCRDGRIAEALATARQTLRIAEQVPAEDSLAHRVLTRQYLQSSALADISKLIQQAPDLVSRGEREMIERNSVSWTAPFRQWQVAADQWYLTSHARNRVMDSPAGLVAIFLHPLAEIPLATGLVLFLLLRCFRPPLEDAVTPGIGTHLCAWTVGLTLSFVVLGLCPAGLVSGQAQLWALRGSAVVACLAAFSGALFALNRLFDVGIRPLFAAVVTLGLPWLLWMQFASLQSVLNSTVWEAPAVLLFGLPIAAFFVWEISRQDLRLLSRRDLSPRKKAWLVAVLATGTMLTVPWLAYLPELTERRLPVRIPVPSHFRAWELADAEVDLAVFGVSVHPYPERRFADLHPWARALLEWHSYWGLLAASVIALSLVAGWSVFLQFRRSSETWRQMLRTSTRRQLRCLASDVADSLLVVGTAALLLYLATIPSAIDETQQRYELRRARLIDARAAWNELVAEANDRS